MPTNLINHQGQQVVFIDYTACKTKEDLIDTLIDAESFIKRMPGKSLTLSDFTGTHGSSEFMAEAKRAGRETFDHKVERAALIGITGIKMILLNGYNLVVKNKIMSFDTRDKALGYLVS